MTAPMTRLTAPTSPSAVRVAGACTAPEPSASTTTRIAPRPPTVETPASAVVTAAPPRAYAPGAHTWKGTSASLKAAASTRRTAPAPSVVRAAPVGPAVMTASSRREPVAATHSPAPRAARAKDSTAVTSRSIAAAPRPRTARSASSATKGRVASSRPTSHDPRSRAPTVTAAPVVPASTVVSTTTMSSVRSSPRRSSRRATAARPASIATVWRVAPVGVTACRQVLAARACSSATRAVGGQRVVAPPARRLATAPASPASSPSAVTATTGPRRAGAMASTTRTRTAASPGASTGRSASQSKVTVIGPPPAGRRSPAGSPTSRGPGRHRGAR